jgi:hypothetical protein
VATPPADIEPIEPISLELIDGPVVIPPQS